MEISKTEFDVLEAIWQGHPVSANEVVERLNQEQQQEAGSDEKSWHEKTVKTLINRLVKKGALGFEKQQRRYLYYPQLEREAYTLKQSKNLIERMFSGKIAPLVAGFARSKQLNKHDINELKAVIKEWEQEND